MWKGVHRQNRRPSARMLAGVLFSLALGLGPAVLLLLRADPGHAEVHPPDAETLLQEGERAFARGAYGQAADAWTQAAQRYEADGKARDQGHALIYVAQAHQALGRLMKAQQSLELALAIAHSSNDALLTATVFDSLGRIYLGSGQLDAARAHLEQGLGIARQLNQPGLLAALLNDQAVLLAAQDRFADSFEAAREAIGLADRSGQSTLAGRAQINAAWSALRQQTYPLAETQLEEAVRRLDALPSSQSKAFDLVGIGLAYQDLSLQLPSGADSFRATAAQSFRRANGIAAEVGDLRTQSYALGYLGHLAELERRGEEALELTRQAIFAAQAAEAPESLYLWKWQAGRLLRSQASLDEAIAAYQGAIIALQPIRSELIGGPMPGIGSQRSSTRALYTELADLLLQRSARLQDRTTAEQYLLAARDTIELLKAAEVREYFGDECVDQLRARITKLDQISPATAVIYPIVLTDRLELLVTLPSGLKRMTVSIPGDDLTRIIRSLRRNLEKRTTLEYRPPAQQLYNLLIRPLEPDLEAGKIETLVFVPDGPLRTIPLSALHDGKQFLIKKYAVATTPGLTLTDPRSVKQSNLKVLSSGLTLAVQGFPPLPHAAEELQTIQGLYQGDQLLDRDFVLTRLESKSRERPFTVLHVASHARFTSDVSNAFILTFDGKLSVGQLDRLIGLFKYREDPLELLSLSACQTAVGDERAALGLAGVAIKAGARSALATLWFINDEASAKLVGEFYTHLKAGASSKAVALQRAQLALLEDPVFEHPAYWSPFLLLNNWL